MVLAGDAVVCCSPAVAAVEFTIRAGGSGMVGKRLYPFLWCGFRSGGSVGGGEI